MFLFLIFGGVKGCRVTRCERTWDSHAGPLLFHFPYFFALVAGCWLVCLLFLLLEALSFYKNGHFDLPFFPVADFVDSLCFTPPCSPRACDKITDQVPLLFRCVSFSARFERVPGKRVFLLLLSKPPLRPIFTLIVSPPVFGCLPSWIPPSTGNAGFPLTRSRQINRARPFPSVPFPLFSLKMARAQLNSPPIRFC